MNLRLPSGTRDVLPEEMAERRRIERALLDTFAAAGYGEVSTPELEYPETMELGRLTAPYRVTSDSGEELALRADMTGPIARLAATRYADVAPPLRFSYSAVVHRSVSPGKGEARELLQAGIELLGVPGPEGTAEAITVLSQALEAWMKGVFACNAYIDAQAPWALRKTDPERMHAVLAALVGAIRRLAIAAMPVIPNAAAAILDQLGAQARDHAAIDTAWDPTAIHITPPAPVFPRLELAA